MNLYELAKQIVCNIVAVALSMTVAAVETLLRHRPDWLERVEHLAFRLKAAGASGRATEPSDMRQPAASPNRRQLQAVGGHEQPRETDHPLDTERVLRAYGELWQFVHALRSEGLSLDDSFCERIEREWTVATLLTYMRNADRSLQEHASKALDSAALMLMPSIDGDGAEVVSIGNR